MVHEIQTKSGVLSIHNLDNGEILIEQNHETVYIEVGKLPDMIAALTEAWQKLR